jgi:hypothetical protein
MRYAAEQMLVGDIHTKWQYNNDEGRIAGIAGIAGIAVVAHETACIPLLS